MFTYKWVDEIGNEHGCVFNNGWQRMSYCKAAIYHNMHMIETNECGINVTHTIESWYLVSYSTPIMKVFKHENNTAGYTKYRIRFDANVFNVSMTTIHQVSRFLNNIVGCPISYHALKDYVNSVSYGLGFGDMVYDTETCSVYVMNQDNVDNIIYNECPDYLYW